MTQDFTAKPIECSEVTVQTSKAVLDYCSSSTIGVGIAIAAVILAVGLFSISIAIACSRYP